MTWTFDDGGRAAAGFKGEAGDCVTRAIVIATGLDYREVYDELGRRGADVASRRRARKYTHTRGGNRRSTTARDGVYKDVYRPYLESLGWVWTPTMNIGQGTTVHLRADELPPGRLIVSVSKHTVAVIDGVIRDTHDPSRAGTRCVYGYFRPGSVAP